MSRDASNAIYHGLQLLRLDLLEAFKQAAKTIDELASSKDQDVSALAKQSKADFNHLASFFSNKAMQDKYLSKLMAVSSLDILRAMANGDPNDAVASEAMAKDAIARIEKALRFLKQYSDLSKGEQPAIDAVMGIAPPEYKLLLNSMTPDLRRATIRHSAASTILRPLIQLVKN